MAFNRFAINQFKRGSYSTTPSRSKPSMDSRESVYNDLAVSTVHDETTGTDVTVTSLSDDVWDFSHELFYSGVRSACIEIDWSELLENEHMLDFEKATSLINSSKRILYVLKCERAPGYKPWKPRSLSTGFTALKVIARWMSKRGIFRYADIGIKEFQEFRRSLDSVTLSTRKQTFGMISAIYQQRNTLEDVFPRHPWPNEPHHGDIVLDDERQTLAFPPEVSKQLFTNAFRVVENGKETVRLWKEWCAIRGNERYKRNNRQVYSPAANEFRAIHGPSTQYSIENVKLRRACIITILGLTGMRASELLNLTRNCLEVTTGKDGEAFYWVKGYTFKLHNKPHAHKWLVPPIVHEAITLAMGTTEYLHEAMNEDIEKVATLETQPSLPVESLIAIKGFKRDFGKIFLIRHPSANPLLSNVGVMGYDGVKQCLQEFFEEYDIRTMDGEIWPIRSHQFRRTFARMIAASSMGDLRYLKYHLDHWSIEMTAHYAKGGQTDEEIFAFITEERQALQAELASDWLHPKTPLSGGAALQIKEVRSRPEVMAIENKQEFVEMMSSEVLLRGTGHSWCMASNNGCGGKGLYDATLCVTCGDGIIDSAHASFWLAIREQQLELLDKFGDSLGDATRARCERHLQKAQKVLRELGLIYSRES